MSGVEPYVTEAPPPRPRWFGDVGIVAAAVLIIAAIASTLSWCDFSLQSYRLSAGVPVLLCPGGASSGDIPAGTTVRVTAVYSGSLGEFRELTAAGGATGWAAATDIDAAAGVTTRDIFGLPSVSDPAFDGPDCTSTAPTTVVTTETTTTAVETTAVVTTAAQNTTVPTTVGRTTSPRPTIRPTVAPTAAATTATTVAKTTTTADTDGPDVGPVRLKPPTITENVANVPGVAAVCAPGTTIAQLSVSVTDPSGVQSVTYAVTVKGLDEGGPLSNVDEVYSGTVGPFSGAFPPGDKATSAVIAVLITATDNKGNVTRTTGSGTLLRCVAPVTTTTVPKSTTTTIIIF